MAHPVMWFEVLGTEAAGAPAALAAGEEALALVVADRVDGDAGPLGQFVDAPVAHEFALKVWDTGVESPEDREGV